MTTEDSYVVKNVLPDFECSYVLKKQPNILSLAGLISNEGLCSWLICRNTHSHYNSAQKATDISRASVNCM